MEIILSIQNRVYESEAKELCWDVDLAELYATETRSLNQAVKRNQSRFPADFMFQLTKEEWDFIVI